MAKRRTPYLSAIDRTVDKRELPFNARTTKRSVLDPWSDTGSRITVTKSIRSDPLGRLLAHKQISEHQEAAGRHVQNMFEATVHIKSPDYSKPPAAGGIADKSATDRQLRDYKRLQYARQELGRASFELVRDVLVERISPKEIAALSGKSGEHAERYYSARFRDALDELATIFGFQGEAPRRRQVRDKLSELAKDATNPKLHAAMRLAAELKEAA